MKISCVNCTAAGNSPLWRLSSSGAVVSSLLKFAVWLPPKIRDRKTCTPCAPSGKDSLKLPPTHSLYACNTALFFIPSSGAFHDNNNNGNSNGGNNCCLDMRNEKKNRNKKTSKRLFAIKRCCKREKYIIKCNFLMKSHSA